MPHPEVSGSAGMAEIAQALIGLGRRMRTGTDASVLVAVAQAGAHHIAGARWASVTVARHDRVRTLAATAPVAAHADALQQEIGAGPAVDPAPGRDVYVCGNLAGRCRWPVLGARLHQRLGLTSLASFRLHLVGEPEAVAALLLYSDAPDAFGDEALAAGSLLAAHGALAVSAQLHRQRAQHLDQALAPTREVGTAVGVLMTRYGPPARRPWRCCAPPPRTPTDPWPRSPPRSSTPNSNACRPCPPPPHPAPGRPLRQARDSR